MDATAVILETEKSQSYFDVDRELPTVPDSSIDPVEVTLVSASTENDIVSKDNLEEYSLDVDILAVNMEDHLEISVDKNDPDQLLVQWSCRAQEVTRQEKMDFQLFYAYLDNGRIIRSHQSLDENIQFDFIFSTDDTPDKQGLQTIPPTPHQRTKSTTSNVNGKRTTLECVENAPRQPSIKAFTAAEHAWRDRLRKMWPHPRNRSNFQYTSSIVLKRIHVRVVRMITVKSRHNPIPHKEYVIELRYGSHRWEIQRRTLDFFALHSKLAIFQGFTRLKIMPTYPFLPTLPTRERRSAIVTLADHDDLTYSSAKEHARFMRIEKYLHEMLQNTDPRGFSARELCSFLECSTLSFCDDIGPKNMEGFLAKRAGGRRFGFLFDSLISSMFYTFGKKWFIAKDSFLAYIDEPDSFIIKEVLLFDRYMEVTTGTHSTNADVVYIRNGYRTLQAKAPSSRKAQQWRKRLLGLAARSVYTMRQPHDSFAPVRAQCRAQYYIDARDYYIAVKEALLCAREQIFILGWWISPHLYLGRPCHEEHRLDRILLKKAEEGVDIYIVLYKEVTLVLGNNSDYTKKYLNTLHPNIHVQRHPNHVGANRTLMWAHHEKLVVIDQSIALGGGLDLCYGRDDTSDHLLFDPRPTAAKSPIKSQKRHKAMYHIDFFKFPQGDVWPGLDYYNPRVRDVKHGDFPDNVLFDKSHVPRMPWHDVAYKVFGQPARDLTRHFIQRWNSVKTFKGKQHTKLPYLLPKTDNLFVSTDKSVPFSSSFEYLALLGSPKEMSRLSLSATLKGGEANVTDDEEECIIHSVESSSRESDVGLPVGLENGVTFDGTCRIQVLRSVGEWSSYMPVEHSILHAYISMIEHAQHFIYIENQFFISATAGYAVENPIVQTLAARIVRAHREKTNLRVIVVMPLVPGFEGEFVQKSASTFTKIMHYQYQTISRSPTSLFQLLEQEGIQPSDYISFHGLRKFSQYAGGCITEQIYVHSKMLIVDDRLALIGSANLNDRSMLGVRDSELAILVEDGKKVETVMDGQPFLAGEFAHRLRMALFQEHTGMTSHLGGKEENGISLEDPVACFNDWKSISLENTNIYRQAFGCIPDNTITTWKQLRERKRMLGEKKKNDVNSMEGLSRIRGHLVDFSVFFLCDEDLMSGTVNVLPEELYT